ncbi:MAG TPA: aminotransferase class V-fold PLP-dependent enzyme [Gaiellaceae bacterium]
MSSRVDLLADAAEVVRKAWSGFDQYRAGQPALDTGLAELLARGLPEEPTDARQCLEDAARALDQSLAQPRPRFFAFIGSAGLEAGVVGDLLAATFDVNLASWAGAATKLEAQTLRWLGELVGYPTGGGAFTSGGTLSNVTALAAAREAALPGSRADGLTGVRAAVYCSAEAHHSVVRAAEMLGIGSRWVRSLPIDGERRLQSRAVADAIEADVADGVVPVAVVATAGTTLTGAVDPIAELGAVCARRNVWLHVDGAYGAPAAALPELAERFAGLAAADSLSIDAHKWLYVPKACGVVLARRASDLLRVFGHEEAYFPHERDDLHSADHTLEYSRPLRALKLWLAFRVHGADAFRAAIRRNLAHARLCRELVDEAPDLEALPCRPQLTIVPFRHRPARVEDLDRHNLAIVAELQSHGDVWVSSAMIDGRAYVRPCFVNYRTSDDDVRALVTLVRRVGAELASA